MRVDSRVCKVYLISIKLVVGAWVGRWVEVKRLNQSVLNLIYKLPRVAGLATASENDFYNTQFLTNYRHYVSSPGNDHYTS